MQCSGREYTTGLDLFFLKNENIRRYYTIKAGRGSRTHAHNRRLPQFAIIMCTLKKESMDFDTPRLPNTVHRNIIEG